MVLLLKEKAKLLFHHVDVITNVKEGEKLESRFLIHSKERVLIYSGYLKTIDPISSSVILCLIESGKIVEQVIVLGRIVDDVIISEKNNVLQPGDVEQIIKQDTVKRVKNSTFYSQNKTPVPITLEEIQQRRDSIMEWLTKNRIPAKVDILSNEIIVAGKVRLKAPYQYSSDYVCPTRVILKRIKDIVDSRHILKENVETTHEGSRSN